MILVCPHCGVDNDARRRFCGGEDGHAGCGGGLEVLCPACGYSNRRGDKYCGGCGLWLADSQVTAPNAGVETAKRDELRTITVMMADLDGFAEMTERLGRERQTDIMNQVFERLAGEHIVRSFDGYIDKFLDGDIMALFGAPVAHEDAPERALRAAVRMHAELARLHEDGTIPAQAPLRLRIGLNTGPVRVGGVGAGGRMEYTAMGDTVNLAARLMTACAWGQSLISSHTHRRCQGSFELEALPPVKVKGKSQPVPIWSVVAEKRRAARIEIAQSAGMSRMVGRDDLLLAIQDAWDRASSGQGGTLGVRGEAGLGKSRLVFELARGLDGATTRFLEGRCLSYGANLSYLPVREVLSQLLAIDDLDSSDVRLVKIAAGVADACPQAEQAVPALAFLLGLEPDDETWSASEPQQRRGWLRAAFTALLTGAAAARPMLVFVDDLQWLDGDSAELLDDLHDAAPAAPLLLVTAFRPDYEAHWTTDYQGLDLWRLTEDETREVVGSLMAARGLIEDERRIEPSLAEAVYHKSQGNPFFIDQVVTALVERAELSGRPTIDYRRGRLLITEDELGNLVPDSVEEILLSRIDKLPSEPRALLQAASVAIIGRYFRRSALEFVLERRDLGDLLDLLGHRELVHLESRHDQDEEYVFEHALTRDVAYNALLRTERRRLHERMGQYIENHYAASLDAYLDDLSYHYYNSAAAGRALLYLPRSADRAARVFSNQQALLHFKRALEKTDEVGESALADKLAVLRGITLVQSRTGDAELIDYCAQRLELARRLDDPLAVIDASYMLARRHTELGEFDAAHGYFDQSLAEYEALGDWSGVRDTHFGIGNLWYLQGHFESALEHFQAALDVQLGKMEFDRFGQWVAYNNLAAVYDAMGRFADMLAACDTCAELLDGLDEGDPMRVQLQCYTSGNLGSAHRNLGHLDDALASYRTTLANAQATGERTIEAEVRYWLGCTLTGAGRLAEAREQLDEALELARETGHSRWEAGALAAMAELARVSDDHAAAEARLAEARAVRERVGELAAAEEIDLAASRLALALGRADEAETLAEGVVKTLASGHREAEHALALLDLAAARLAQGWPADDVLEAALSLAERMGLEPLAARGRRLRVWPGDLDEAVRLAEACGLAEEQVAALGARAAARRCSADLDRAEALVARLGEQAGPGWSARVRRLYLAPAQAVLA
ncbi:MAG: AAA family ATPase [Armatimonadetes bacterium]|nr:AAA family ATPase [Armatimonadota bacterium]